MAAETPVTLGEYKTWSIKLIAGISNQGDVVMPPINDVIPGGANRAPIYQLATDGSWQIKGDTTKFRNYDTAGNLVDYLYYTIKRTEYDSPPDYTWRTLSKNGNRAFITFTGQTAKLYLNSTSVPVTYLYNVILSYDWNGSEWLLSGVTERGGYNTLAHMWPLTNYDGTRLILAKSNYGSIRYRDYNMYVLSGGKWVTQGFSISNLDIFNNPYLDMDLTGNTIAVTEGTSLRIYRDELNNNTWSLYGSITHPVSIGNRVSISGNGKYVFVNGSKPGIYEIVLPTDSYHSVYSNTGNMRYCGDLPLDLANQPATYGILNEDASVISVTYPSNPNTIMFYDITGLGYQQTISFAPTNRTCIDYQPSINYGWQMSGNAKTLISGNLVWGGTGSLSIWERFRRKNEEPKDTFRRLRLLGYI
jgi:hypothetical protein